MDKLIDALKKEFEAYVERVVNARSCCKDGKAIEAHGGIITPSETVPPRPEAPAPETDTDLPWDERIHSSNRKKTAKGVWVRRRGVADDIFNAVVSELKMKMAGVTHEDIALTNPGSLVDPPAPEIPATPPVPEIPATPPVPETPATPAGDKPTFKGLMEKITLLRGQGKITDAMVNDIIASCGGSNIIDLIQPPNATMLEQVYSIIAGL